MIILGFLSAIFAGYRESKKDDIKMKPYGMVRDTPFLHGTEYLTELYNNATTKEQQDCVLENILYHYDLVKDNERYMKLHDRIINERWK